MLTTSRSGMCTSMLSALYLGLTRSHTTSPRGTCQALQVLYLRPDRSFTAYDGERCHYCRLIPFSLCSTESFVIAYCCSRVFLSRVAPCVVAMPTVCAPAVATNMFFRSLRPRTFPSAFAVGGIIPCVSEVHTTIFLVRLAGAKRSSLRVRFGRVFSHAQSRDQGCLPRNDTLARGPRRGHQRLLLALLL